MLYDPVRLANGARIHLFKVDRGALEDDREADRIATKLRERLFAAHRPPDVVIMEGEPDENPRLFGADESVAQIRSMLAAIAGHGWAPVQFELQS
jgi:fructose-1,6-bisphosphatase/sedoheptulose 1,7-bisphosphatase-like protein